jgi:ATP-dependent Clp protease protease subunit
MPEAILKIYSDIGVSDGFSQMFGIEDDLTSAKIVSEFLDANKEASEIIVKINSRGGDVQEGWAIYDLLTTSGKKIKTIGEGKVYSIATIVFLAGSEREMLANADGLIHNPYIPPYTLSDKYESTDLIKIAENLAQEEEKILDFYSEKTGTAKEKLAEYMKEETKLSAEDMVTLGFATKVIEPVKAFAYIKPKNNFIMTETQEAKFFEKLGSTLDSAVAKMFSRLPVKNIVLKDVDGKELTVEKETGDPAVGDKATPDGTFVLETGQTVTVLNGEITEIAEKPTGETELEKANAKIADLEAKIAEAEAAKASFTKKETQAVALINELTALKNTWKPSGRQRVNENKEVGVIDFARVHEIIKNSKT